MYKLINLSLLIVTLVLTNTSVQAAEFEAVKTISNNSLEDFAATIADLKNLWPSDAYLQIDRLSIKSRTNDDSCHETLEQAVMVARKQAGTELPKEIDIERRNKSDKDLKEAVATALTHAEYHEATRNIPSLALQLGKAVDEQSGIQLFTLAELSGFTFCQSLAIIDNNAEEILLISSCWVD